MSNKLRLGLLILILLGATFVRLYRIAATQTFLEDEGRDMLIVHRMLETKLPVLLGPQTSTGNMYLGPMYYYIITPSLMLSGGDPVGPAIFIALTGILTVYLLYVFGRRWFGALGGFVAGALYAFLPYPVAFTRNSWNPNLVPLIMLLLIYLTSRIKLSEHKWQWPVFWFGILAGILMQLHYMALVGLGALGIYIIINNYRELKKLLVALGYGLLGMLTSLAPFILFELRNNFINSRALVGFVTGTTEKNISFDQSAFGWWHNVTKTYTSLLSGQLGANSFHPEGASLIIGVVFLILIFVSIVSYHKLENLRLLLVTFIVSSLVLGFYQDRIHLHYLGFMLPVIYLIIGGLTQLPRVRFVVLGLAMLLLAYTTPTLLRYISSGPTHQVLKAEMVADYIKSRAAGRPYNVVSDQLTQTSPFQYFLALDGNTPSNTQETTLFVICDGALCSKDQETTTLIYLTGPSHPALAAYLGHPQLNEFRLPRVIISNEHVAHGIWVAELAVIKE